MHTIVCNKSYYGPAILILWPRNINAIHKSASVHVEYDSHICSTGIYSVSSMQVLCDMAMANNA